MNCDAARALGCPLAEMGQMCRDVRSCGRCFDGGRTKDRFTDSLQLTSRDDREQSCGHGYQCLDLGSGVLVASGARVDMHGAACLVFHRRADRGPSLAGGAVFLGLLARTSGELAPARSTFREEHEAFPNLAIALRRERPGCAQARSAGTRLTHWPHPQGRAAN